MSATAGRSGGSSGRNGSRVVRLGRALVDLLLPETGCAICGGPLSWEPEACPACLNDIFDGDSRSRTCAHEAAWGGAGGHALTSPSARFLDGVVTAGAYGGVLEKAVLRLKHTPDRRLARLLARLLAERLGERAGTAAWAGVVPVPLHRDRLRERGFNQAAVLGRELAVLLGAAVLDGLCERVRPTPLQSTLSRQDRTRNLGGAFRLRDDRWLRPAGRLLVVDDVLTTGATVAELARTLKAGGAVAGVWCAVVARA